MPIFNIKANQVFRYDLLSYVTCDFLLCVCFERRFSRQIYGEDSFLLQMCECLINIRRFVTSAGDMFQASNVGEDVVSRSDETSARQKTLFTQL